MFRSLRTAVGTAGLALCLSVAPQSVRADDVTEAIKEGLQNYQQGNPSGAMESLNYAVQLIMQKKGGDLAALLPAPLSGWTAEEASSQAAGSAMFGGGVSAEREYTKDNSRVRINLMTDSPMLQAMLPMMSNPAMATADGGKLERIGGQKAVVKYDAGNKSGSVTVVVANRILVTIEGDGVSREDLMAYAAAIDYKKIGAQP